MSFNLNVNRSIATIFGSAFFHAFPFSMSICELASSPMIEERRLVCIGLRNLRIGDEDQVFETLMRLLQDSNASVRLEAGKTLTVLRT